MRNKIVKTISCLFLLGAPLTGLAAADAHGKTPAAPEPEPVVEPEVPDAPANPLPRFITAPRAIFKDTEASDKEVTVSYADATFTVIGVLATWNVNSAAVAAILNKNFDRLSAKKISIVTLFSHDTKFTLKEWKKINKPKFRTGIAAIEFIDEQKNPKVPSLWAVDRKGRLIKHLETPTNVEIERLLNQLSNWTDF